MNFTTLQKIWEIFFLSDINPVWTFFTFQWVKFYQHFDLLAYSFATIWTVVTLYIALEAVKFTWWTICMAQLVITPILWLEFYLIVLVTLVPVSWIVGWFFPHKNVGIQLGEYTQQFVTWLRNKPFGYWKSYRPPLAGWGNSDATIAVLASKR